MKKEEDMRITGFIISALLALGAAPAFAASAASPVNQMIQFYSPPDEFHLFKEASDKNLSYDSEKTIRICAKANRHMTGLKVTHDGNTSMVKPGECATYTARNFKLSPSGVVDDNYGLEGTIEEQES
jgi:hypothetical protein